MDLPKNMDFADLQRIADALASKQAAHDAVVSRLENNIKELQTENNEVLRELGDMSRERDLLDREIAAKESVLAGLGDQISHYDAVLLPQIQNDVRQSAERLERKKAEYQQLIEKYQRSWSQYEEVYKKLPRAAERDALETKTKLMRIELMKKKELAIEKAKEAQQVQEMKARRLEVLRTAFLEKHAEEQAMQIEVNKLEEEIIEIEARVTEKERIKKLEEQQRLESQTEQEASQSKPDCMDTTQQEEAEQTSTLKIRIPTFKMPSFADLEVKPRTSETQPHQETTVSLSQGLPSPSFLPRMKFLSKLSTSQPVGSPSTYGSRTSVSKKASIEKAGRSKKEKEKPIATPAGPGPSRTEHIAGPGNNKKEQILSTDNIAAMMKESNRPNAPCFQNKPTNSGVEVTQECRNASLSQESITDDHNVIQDNLSAELMDVDPLIETTHANQIGQAATESNAIEATAGSTDDDVELFYNEGDNMSPTEDGAYDFNGEYGSDYNSIESPPPPQFDAVMSPVHAAFEASPNHSADYPQGDDIESFGGFNFFPKAVSNMFGGQSTSEVTKEGKDKQQYSFRF